MVSCSGGSTPNQFIDPETPACAKPTVAEYADMDWQVIFSDEFNGTDVIEDTKWEKSYSTEPRAAREGTNVKEWYWLKENVWCEGGNLVLKVEKPRDGVMYCGGIKTKNIYDYKYGYMEARIKVADVTKGTHTALWLQSLTTRNVDGTAHDGGEIDVLESAWDDEYTEAVVHFDGYDEYHQSLGLPYRPKGMHDGFHIYSLYWDENSVRIFYDGEFMTEFTGKWVPRVNEYLVLSVGASFGLEGDQYFTDQPIGYLTEAHVDYIRVWQAPGCGM